MIGKYNKIRKFLHRHPELSEKEIITSDYILKQLKKTNPNEVITNVGGHGIIAVFKGNGTGLTTVFRCELDALPIIETSDIPHKSTNKGISHACGHDGHMTIMLAFADWISVNREMVNGNICLLFQPAEETASGALNVLKDDSFIKLNPDYIFALHNLPGFKSNSVILKEGVFAAASMGMKFWFEGKTSHAGHPENGNNPLFAMQAFINALQNIPHRKIRLHDAGLITIIHMKLGEEAFGTSPGKGVVMATLRANSDDSLEIMADCAEQLAANLAKVYGLSLKSERVEQFAATVNDENAFKIIKKAAIESDLHIIHQSHPFPWTEDFSFFSQKYSTAFFGLGSGINHPQLHNPNYDFPEELIETGLKIFSQIIREVNKHEA